MEYIVSSFLSAEGLFVATGGIFLPSVFLLCLRRVTFSQQRKKVTYRRRKVGCRRQKKGLLSERHPPEAKQ